MSNENKIDNKNTVPAELIENLAKMHFADREADRALAKELVGQMMNLGLAALEVMRNEAAERADERLRNERAERTERQRNAHAGVRR